MSIIASKSVHGKNFCQKKNPACMVSVDVLSEYQKGKQMAHTMEDFHKDFVKEHLNLLSPEEVTGLITEAIETA